MNRWLALLLAAASALAAAAPAVAQTLNAAWDGEWQARETTQGRPDASLSITRLGARSLLTQGGQPCTLAYAAMVELPALVQRIQLLQAWQLDVRHWPAGTDPSQLVGLRREFDTALRMIGALPGPRYRSTRISGEGCDDADDIFFVLHPGQRLLRFRFPSSSLGVDVTVFHKRGSP